MSDSPETCLPTTTWFLYSEGEEEPLGSIYRKALPEVGASIEEDATRGIKAAEIVSFTELRATCAMRRFKVVVRPVS
jgi:hypothetical protein